MLAFQHFVKFENFEKLFQKIWFMIYKYKFYWLKMYEFIVNLFIPICFSKVIILINYSFQTRFLLIVLLKNEWIK